MLGRLFGHLGLKVLSVALAFVLWVMVAGQKQAERSLQIPVEFQNIPDQLEVTGDTPAFANVRIRGAATALGQLRGGDLVVVVDLSTARAGHRIFHLTPEQVTAPTGIRVQQVVPATVNLTFETSISKTVPVVPAVEGTPAPGYVVGQVAASPHEVEVVGPESAMMRLVRATTEPVSLNGASARVRDTVTIGLSETAARLRNPRSAVVTIDILPAPIERVVSAVPVALRGIGRAGHAAAIPQYVTVTARGPGNVVRNLAPAAIPAYVDLTGLQRGQYNLPVRFDPTGEYSVTAVEPQHVRVTIQ